MGIRESDSLITDYFARFTPHYISDAAPPDARQTAEWIAEDYPAPGPGLGQRAGAGNKRRDGPIGAGISTWWFISDAGRVYVGRPPLPGY